MKKCIFLITMAAAGLTFCSCSDHSTSSYDANQTAIIENAKSIFGNIDPQQDWSSINSGNITITADADLDDIVKVQILTESPFGNDEATVLNEADVKKGSTVSLTYDAPKIYDELVAACVSSKGVYYVKVFTPGDASLSFSKSSAQARTTRAEGSLPSPSSIVLGSPIKSFNAIRTESTQNSEYNLVMVNDKFNGNGNLTGKNFYYDLWSDGTWSNDRLWAPVSGPSGDWSYADGTVYKAVSEDFTTDELNTIKSIVNTYLKKNASAGENATNGKRNNWERIAASNEYFTVNNNYVVSNGTPVTLIPVQMNSTEAGYNTIYYYYYNPATTASMTSEEEVNYIKSLPKYKAINGARQDNFKKTKEYLLPYYGDGTPSAGTSAISTSIPKGYKIGFLNRKNYANTDNEAVCANGCTYGDGRLNYEVNHLMGHYFSAMDKTVSQQLRPVSPTAALGVRYGSTTNGMEFTSPRIGVFSANNSTYLCFEDGSDCNFADMIVEISQGTEIIDETPTPEAAAYTMCFEDRPATADYDMNDVVLQAIRVNETHIQLALVACGGFDKVMIKGLGNSYLSSKEVHEFFGLTAGQAFVNTVKDGLYLNPVSEVFTVDQGVRIEDFLRQVYIENQTTGRTVSLPNAGEPPYAIIVPLNFQYPLEGQSITTAYTEFLKWAQDINQSGNWYQMGDAEMIYPDMFSSRQR